MASHQHESAYQSKSKGMASGPTFALNTFLNSSYEIVPDSSLQQQTHQQRHPRPRRVRITGSHDNARAQK